MFITTGDIYTKPYNIIDVISSHVVMARNMFSKMLSGFKTNFGGHIGGFEKLYEYLKEEAVKELKQKAGALNADGIVMVRFEFVEIPSIEGAALHVYGTAIKF
ncbi:heavy metal-binding domain-containing protein [bacterium]|nr:heavy metal-binding domain-containing protein [bacterium]